MIAPIDGALREGEFLASGGLFIPKYGCIVSMRGVREASYFVAACIPRGEGLRCLGSEG
jgi:hypothetical protein